VLRLRGKVEKELWKLSNPKGRPFAKLLCLQGELLNELKNVREKNETAEMSVSN